MFNRGRWNFRWKTSPIYMHLRSSHGLLFDFSCPSFKSNISDIERQQYVLQFSDHSKWTFTKPKDNWAGYCRMHMSSRMIWFRALGSYTSRFSACTYGFWKKEKPKLAEILKFRGWGKQCIIRRNTKISQFKWSVSRKIILIHGNHGEILRSFNGSQTRHKGFLRS